MGKIEEQVENTQEQAPEVKTINGVSSEDKFPLMLTLAQLSIIGMVCNPITLLASLPRMVKEGMNPIKALMVIQEAGQIAEIVMKTDINGMPLNEFMDDTIRKNAEAGDPGAIERLAQIEALKNERAEMEAAIKAESEAEPKDEEKE